MVQQLPPRQALCRLLATVWDPQAMPDHASIPWYDLLHLVEPGNLCALPFHLTHSLHSSIPPDVLQQFEQLYYHTIAANSRCLNQLALLADDFSHSGIPLLILKGAAIAQDLYPDPTLRLIGDIDLIVPFQQVPASRQLLLGLGYRPSLVEPRPGAFLRDTNEELYQHLEPGHAIVELHWHILDVPYYLHRLPMDWFWRNTQPLSIAGLTFQVLNPTANLIYLPAHLALHHRFKRLHSLYDLALLIFKYQDRLDWEEVTAAAQSFELVSVLQSTLVHLTECWPELPLDQPRQLLHRLQPTPTDARLFRLLTTQSRTPTLDLYTSLVSLPDFKSRLRFAFARLFPQPAYMHTRYNIKKPWHLPGWYLYRLTSGLWRFLLQLSRARIIDRGSDDTSPN